MPEYQMADPRDKAIAASQSAETCEVGCGVIFPGGGRLIATAALPLHCCRGCCAVVEGESVPEAAAHGRRSPTGPRGYIALLGTDRRNSSSWRLQNLGMRMVRWPRVSSL